MTTEESRLLVRLPSHLRERLQKLADREYRSLTGEILHLLDLALKIKEREESDKEAAAGEK